MDVAERNEVVEMVDLDHLAPVQVRCQLRNDVVDELVAVLEQGSELEPGLAIRDGGTLWLAAGCHRREAYLRTGRKAMPVIVCDGSRRDAMIAGVSSNRQHLGGMWSRADKEHAAKLLLREHPDMSDRCVAELVGVSGTTVGRYRAALTSTITTGQSDVRVGRDGRRIAVDGIGKGRPPADKPPCRQEHQDARGAALDRDRCRCGNHWTSDGEGGRFCEECGTGRPDDDATFKVAAGSADIDEEDCGHRPTDAPLADFDPFSDTVSKKRKPPARPMEDDFRALHKSIGLVKRDVDKLSHHYPGPHYERAIKALDAAEDILTAWEELERL